MVTEEKSKVDIRAELGKIKNPSSGLLKSINGTEDPFKNPDILGLQLFWHFNGLMSDGEVSYFPKWTMEIGMHGSEKVYPFTHLPGGVTLSADELETLTAEGLEAKYTSLPPSVAFTFRGFSVSGTVDMVMYLSVEEATAFAREMGIIGADAAFSGGGITLTNEGDHIEVVD